MSMIDELVAWYISRRLLHPPNSVHKCGGDLPRPQLFDEVFQWDGIRGDQLACWVLHPKRLRVEVKTRAEWASHDAAKPDTHHSDLVDEYAAPRLEDGTPPIVRIYSVDEAALNLNRTIVVLHGWWDSVLKRPYLRALAATLANSGYRVVMPDLRAHGCSGGSYISYGIHDRDDLSLLLDELERRGWNGTGSVGVFGHSQGGNIALMAVEAEQRFGAVVAASAPQSLRWILPLTVRRKHPWMGKYVTERAFDRTMIKAGRRVGIDFRESSAVRAISEMKTPVLLIHGGKDETVPFESSEAIFNARPGNTETLFFQNESHAAYLVTKAQAIHDRCHQFFNTYLK